MPLNPIYNGSWPIAAVLAVVGHASSEKMAMVTQHCSKVGVIINKLLEINRPRQQRKSDIVCKLPTFEIMASRLSYSAPLFSSTGYFCTTRFRRERCLESRFAAASFGLLSIFIFHNWSKTYTINPNLAAS